MDDVAFLLRAAADLHAAQSTPTHAIARTLEALATHVHASAVQLSESVPGSRQVVRSRFASTDTLPMPGFIMRYLATADPLVLLAAANASFRGSKPAYADVFTCRELLDRATPAIAKIALDRRSGVGLADGLYAALVRDDSTLILSLHRAKTRPMLWGSREAVIAQLILPELAEMVARQPLPGPTRRLPPRQEQTLALLLRGMSERAISQSLGVSLHTVHGHVKAIYRLFRVNRRSELVGKWVE